MQLFPPAWPGIPGTEVRLSTGVRATRAAVTRHTCNTIIDQTVSHSPAGLLTAAKEFIFLDCI